LKSRAKQQEKLAAIGLGQGKEPSKDLLKQLFGHVYHYEEEKETVLILAPCLGQGNTSKKVQEGKEAHPQDKCRRHYSD